MDKNPTKFIIIFDISSIRRTGKYSNAFIEWWAMRTIELTDLPYDLIRKTNLTDKLVYEYNRMYSLKSESFPAEFIIPEKRLYRILTSRTLLNTMGVYMLDVHYTYITIELDVFNT